MRLGQAQAVLAGVTLASVLAWPVASADSAPGASDTFEVSSMSDEVDANLGDGVCGTASGGCTLRGAIQETNALSGRQTVVLPEGEYVLSRAGCCEDVSSTGDIDVTDDLTLLGGGEASTALIEGVGLGGVERFIDVRQGAIVMISGITLRDLFMSAVLPSSEGCGGAIRNVGDLTLTHLEIRNNIFRRSGAGICNEGVLRVTDSVIENNVAAFVGAGGGIANRSTGLAILDHVEIDLNRSDT